jgi:hypothetical protein
MPFAMLAILVVLVALVVLFAIFLVVRRWLLAEGLRRELPRLVLLWADGASATGGFREWLQHQSGVAIGGAALPRPAAL